MTCIRYIGGVTMLEVEGGMGLRDEGKKYREEQGLAQGHTIVKLVQSHGVQTPT